MADLRKITLDTATSIIKDYNNDIFLLQNESAKTSAQKIQAIKFDNSSFTESGSRFPTKNSNNLELDCGNLEFDIDKENKKIYFTNCTKSALNETTHHQPDILSVKENNKDIGDYCESEDTRKNRSINKRKWPLFYFDENNKIANIKWIGVPATDISENAKEETDDTSSGKPLGINDIETDDRVISMINDNLNKMNLTSIDKKEGLVQNSTFSNKENSCFPTLETEVDTENCFCSSEIPTEEANNNGEKEVESKLKSIMSTNNEILSPENSLSQLENDRVADAKSMTSNEFIGHYGISVNLKNKEQPVAGEKYETDLFPGMKISTSPDLITWDMPLEKSELQINQIENQNISKNNDFLTQKIQENLICFDTISFPELKNEHLAYTDNNSLLNYSYVSLNSENNEIIVKEDEKYLTNACAETENLAAIDFFPWKIAGEKTKFQANEKTSDKHIENEGIIMELYPDETIIKMDESIMQKDESIAKKDGKNSRSDKIDTNEQQSNIQKQKNFKQDGNQSDLSWRGSNSPVSKNEQILESKNTASSGEPPKLPKFLKSNDVLVNKTHSKALNISKKSEDRLNNDSEKGFIKKTKPKALKLKTYTEDNSLLNYGYVSLNSANNEVIANQDEKYGTNACTVTENLTAIDFFSWEMADEKTEFQANEKASDKGIENEGRILETYQDESIIKKDESIIQKNENIAKKDGTNSRHYGKNTKEQQNNAQKQKNFNQDGKQSDLSQKGSKLSVSNNEQRLMDSKSIAGSGESPKLPRLVKSKDNLVNNAPSKELNVSEKSEHRLNNDSQNGFIKKLKPKTLKLKGINSDLMGKVSTKHFLTTVDCGSQKAKCEQLENNCNDDYSHNKVLFGHCPGCTPAESKKTNERTRAAKILSNGSFARDDDTDKRHTRKPRRVKQCKSLENPVEAARKEKRVTFAEEARILPYYPEKSIIEDFYNKSLAKLKTQDSEIEIRECSRNISEATTSDIANKNLKENKTLVKYIKTLDKSKERDSEKEVRDSSEKFSAAMKGDIANESTEENVKPKSENMKAESSENILKEMSNIEKKSIKTGDTSNIIKVGSYSRIENTTPGSNESLAEVTQPSYYDNTVFVDDWSLRCSSEIDLTDDSSSIFEDDNVSVALSENSWLIDPRTNKSLPIKAKNWLKSAGSRTFKRLSFKIKKPPAVEK